MQTAIRPAVRIVSPTLRIVAIGDSVIYGFGDPEGGGWVERLRRQWMSPESPSHALYNLGVRGDGVRQISQRLEAEFRQRGELRHRLPDGMILSVGTNDSAKLQRLTGKNMLAFEEFEAEMAALLDRANSLCSVFFVGMTPIDELQMPFANCLYYNHADQYRYKEATRLACLEREIPYLDLFDRWMSRGETWWKSRLCSDGLHPNTEGYRAILEDVLSWEPFMRWLNSVG